MPRFDRYLLTRQLTVFGFFSLVLVMVYWVNRAVGLFDRLIADGQSALVFLEFSLLTLPNVIRIVLPVSAFAATVQVANRLAQDGELVAMQAAGASAFRLARPVAWFGLAVMALMLVLTHFAVPASRAMLATRSAEVDANVTAQLLSEGRFIHPAAGVTFYIREIAADGALADIFLADERRPGAPVIHSARRAFLLRGEGTPRLVMQDGMSQTLDTATGRLAVTHFADFTFDLGALATGGGRGRLSVEELPTAALLAPDPAVVAATGQDAAAFAAEMHARFAQPLLGLATALVGFAALRLGGFSRMGLWRQILGAIAALVAIQMIGNAATAAVLRDGGLWPLSYAAPAVGIALGAGLLAVAQRPWRRAPAPAAGAAP